MENKDWFIYVVDHHEGPFSATEIKDKIQKGELPPSLYVWKEGYADWVIANEVVEFNKINHSTDNLNITEVKDTESVWCLNSKKTFSGPHSLKTILRKISSGEVQTTDQVWKEGWTTFVPIAKIPELMQKISAETSTNSGAKKSNKASSSAAALGMNGSSVKVYKWYKSTKFFILLILTAAIGLYQNIANNNLDSLLAKAQLDQKVKALNLKPIPFEALVLVKDQLKPFFYSNLKYLPDAIQKVFNPLQLPESISQLDQDKLKHAALASIQNGPSYALAIPQGDELTPSFFIASNQSDGTVIKVLLHGKPGSLVGSVSFDRTAEVVFDKNLAMTQRFSSDGAKPIPKGEYSVSLYIKSQNTPVYSENFFLGGKNDANYKTKLEEYNTQLKNKITQELNEVNQLTSTIESNANESATKFFELAKVKNPTFRLKQWNKYDQQYQAFSSQIKPIIDGALAADKKSSYFLANIYSQISVAFELSEKLHLQETATLKSQGTLDSIQLLASQTLTAINQIKSEIKKVEEKAFPK